MSSDYKDGGLLNSFALQECMKEIQIPENEQKLSDKLKDMQTQGEVITDLRAALLKVEGQRDRLRDELAALREKHGLCIDCGDESPFGDTACCLTCLEKHNKAIKESEG